MNVLQKLVLFINKEHASHNKDRYFCIRFLTGW